jgi:hypothetical protein
MTETFKIAAMDAGLTDDEIRAALAHALQPALDAGELRNVLILSPDFTRFRSNAGFITNFYYRLLTERSSPPPGSATRPYTGLWINRERFN